MPSTPSCVSSSTLKDYRSDLCWKFGRLGGVKCRSGLGSVALPLSAISSAEHQRKARHSSFSLINNAADGFPSRTQCLSHKEISSTSTSASTWISAPPRASHGDGLVSLALLRSFATGMVPYERAAGASPSQCCKCCKCAHREHAACDKCKAGRSTTQMAMMTQTRARHPHLPACRRPRAGQLIRLQHILHIGVSLVYLKRQRIACQDGDSTNSHTTVIRSCASFFFHFS